MGMVIEREFGGVLAMDDVQLPPPTVNNLANLPGPRHAATLGLLEIVSGLARFIFGTAPSGKNCCLISSSLES